MVKVAVVRPGVIYIVFITVFLQSLLLVHTSMLSISVFGAVFFVIFAEVGVVGRIAAAFGFEFTRPAYPPVRVDAGP